MAKPLATGREASPWSLNLTWGCTRCGTQNYRRTSDYKGSKWGGDKVAPKAAPLSIPPGTGFPLSTPPVTPLAESSLPLRASGWHL